MDQRTDHSPGGYVTFDDKGIIIEVNSTLCSMLGYTKAELQGKKFESLLDIAGRIFFQTHFFPLLKMQKIVHEIFLNLKVKDSSLIPVLTSSVREENTDGVENVCIILPVYNRIKYESEILAAKKQAEEALKENQELLVTREEIKRHSKELDKKINELNRINDEVLQFNHIINHEMQECIRKILLFSRLGQQDKNEEYLDRIIETANRLKTINSSLNIFISLDPEQTAFDQVDLNSCIEQAKNEAIATLQFDAIELTSDNLPAVEGSFNDLKLLFYHLISNSVKFRRDENVSVAISSIVYKENIYKSISRKYEYHDVVRITFSDNGQGFDNKHKEYVFSILKKLNHKSGGSGIGLAICKKIVDNHRGEISIDSSENIGTTVKIVLPVKHSV